MGMLKMMNIPANLISGAGKDKIGIAFIERNFVLTNFFKSMILRFKKFYVTSFFTDPYRMFLPSGMPNNTRLILYNADLNHKDLPEKINRLKQIHDYLIIVCYTFAPNRISKKVLEAGAAEVLAIWDIPRFFRNGSAERVASNHK